MKCALTKSAKVNAEAKLSGELCFSSLARSSVLSRRSTSSSKAQSPHGPRRVHHDVAGRPPTRSPRGKFFLELFGGCCRITGAASQRGLRIAQRLEIQLEVWHDLCDPKIQKEVLSWILNGSVWAVWLGTPCTRWARTTGGKDTATTRSGLSCAKFTLRVMKACVQKKHL